MLANKVKRCIKCTIPDTFPGISFSDDGLCVYCQELDRGEPLETERSNLLRSMEDEIEKKRGKGEYDCIVAFSGGKDSTYTLMHMVNHYKLNCLAVTIDNDFVSKQAINNCYTVTNNLGVDFLLFKPASNFMMNMYKNSIRNEGLQTPASTKRISSVCHSCINLINNYMIKLSILHEAPLIAGGYIGGQIPKNASTINMNLIQKEQIKKPFFEKYKQAFGESSEKFFFIKESILTKLPTSTITIINPMLTLNIGEEDIIKTIEKIGWTKPKDTGKNSSNCLLNDLGIAIHYKKHKFHAYEFEVAEQVRLGLMSREDGLKKVTEIPEYEDLKEQINKVGLAKEDLA